MKVYLLPGQCSRNISATPSSPTFADWCIHYCCSVQIPRINRNPKILITPNHSLAIDNGLARSFPHGTAPQGEQTVSTSRLQLGTYMCSYPRVHSCRLLCFFFFAGVYHKCFFVNRSTSQNTSHGVISALSIQNPLMYNL